MSLTNTKWNHIANSSKTVYRCAIHSLGPKPSFELNFGGFHSITLLSMPIQLEITAVLNCSDDSTRIVFSALPPKSKWLEAHVISNISYYTNHLNTPHYTFNLRLTRGIASYPNFGEAVAPGMALNCPGDFSMSTVFLFPLSFCHSLHVSPWKTAHRDHVEPSRISFFSCLLGDGALEYTSSHFLLVHD